MSKVLIVTGGSKGIGQGIIEAYQNQGYQIFSISRTKNQDFKNLTQIEFDLSKTDGIEDLLTGIFEHLNSKEVKKISLINNAGTLGEIGRIEDITDIEKTVQLNTVAPLILVSVFIKLTENWGCEKKIINISSGAAQKPYAGWTVYCATKAAIDMMTKTIALEQDSLQNGVKILSIYPGVVDTDMQAKIRQSDKESFTSLDRFLELKATNSLANATTVGKQILTIDQDKTIENGTILRIEVKLQNDYLESAKKQFEYYKMLCDKTFAQLSEEQLFWQFNEESNSIAMIVKHLWGNMLSRWTDFLTSDGEKEWRNRDEEFENDIATKEELLAKWNEAWQCLFDAINPLETEDLGKEIYIRNQGHTITEAINRQLAHYPYHVGQIVFLGKMLCNNNWQSLSIPKGKSKTFNAEKFSQPKHKQHFTDEFLKED